jgi:heat shock protein HslJ
MLVVDAIRRGLARTASFRLLPASPAWTTELELDDAGGRPVLRFAVDDAGSLGATTWLLDSVDGAAVLTGSDGQPAVILFDAADRRAGREELAVLDRLAAEARAEGFERRLTGSTGCNSFSGRYFVTGRVLSIGDLTTTTDPCPAELLDQEAVVLDILGASSLRVTRPPGRLELRSDDDSRVLRYRAAAPLEDEQWILERQDGRRVGPDEVVTLYLAPDDPASTADIRSGAISGEGPCRPYGGTYRTDGLLVAFGDIAGDDGPCVTPSAERRYLRALRRAAFAEVDGGSLRVLDGQGRELLVYSTPGLP